MFSNSDRLWSSKQFGYVCNLISLILLINQSICSIEAFTIHQTDPFRKISSNNNNNNRSTTLETSSKISKQQQPTTTTTTATTITTSASATTSFYSLHQSSNPSFSYYVTGRKSHDGHEHHEPPRRFQVAKFDFEHVSTPYIILLWIIIVGFAKMGFHVTPKLSSLCPESVVLMILGVVIGLIMYFVGIPEERLQPLTPNLFFLYMLPPIVMDAGYHMPNRLFFDNLVSILLYAVIGTIWNAMAIGLSLYACSKLGVFGEEMPFLDIMLFSSTVSAVDPVAVLAVFEEIHVNEVLYILVFGESLLNDGVTVVLYHMFEGYAEMAYHYGIDSIQTIDYVAGFASFFVVAIGGTAMGVFWGFLAAFVSRFTHHVKIIEPIFVFVMAYLSYLSAEMFHLSGILSLTFCGITMKNYVEENITQKSHTTLKYAMKMLANSSEAIIFVFLGVCTVNDQHHWNTAFVLLTIIFCLVYRTIGVVMLTSLTNRYRLHKVNRVEQFIMSYGGLRGAVAFALILIINRQIIHAREMMVTTIIAVVYFTVFLQGMTVGTLVKILNVKRAEKFELTMNERIHRRLMDHVMAGLEDISGMMMGNYKLRDKFRHYNNRYLSKWFLRDAKEIGNSSRKIFETCSKLDLRDAMTIVSRQQMLNGTKISDHQKSKLSFAAYVNTNYVDNEDGCDRDVCEDKNLSKHPQMLLTVPGNPALATSPQLVIDPNQSLTQLFRSYTQSNLNQLNYESDESSDSSNNGSDSSDRDKDVNVSHRNDEINPIRKYYRKTSMRETKKEMDGKNFNYDIGNMVYSPSLKDLKDAELHHILNDAMFKPFKKSHHYTRSDYYEEPTTHPPFQHQVRMQIRRLISEKEKRRNHHHHHHHHNQHNHHHRQHHSRRNDLNSNSIQNDSIYDNKLRSDSMRQKNLNRSESDRKNLFKNKRNKSETDLDRIESDNYHHRSRDDDGEKITKNIDLNNNNNHNNNDEDDDDDDKENEDAGIVFVAKHSSQSQSQSQSKSQSEVDGKIFPWESNSNEENSIPLSSINHQHHHFNPNESNRLSSHHPKDRSNIANEINDELVKQKEFPSWIENKNYSEINSQDKLNFPSNRDHYRENRQKSHSQTMMKNQQSNNHHNESNDKLIRKNSQSKTNSIMKLEKENRKQSKQKDIVSNENVVVEFSTQKNSDKNLDDFDTDQCDGVMISRL